MLKFMSRRESEKVTWKMTGLLKVANHIQTNWRCCHISHETSALLLVEQWESAFSKVSRKKFKFLGILVTGLILEE